MDDSWREEPATEEQKRYAEQSGIKDPPDITRGGLRDVIVPQAAPERHWYEVSFRQRLMWAAVAAVLLVVLASLQCPWYAIVIAVCGGCVPAVVGRIEVNGFLGFVIVSCVLLITGFFYPSENPLSTSQATVLWTVIGEVFLLRLLGFRATQMLVPLVVVLGMILFADSGAVSPHSGLAAVFGLGINTAVFSVAVIVAEVMGRCSGR